MTVIQIVLKFYVKQVHCQVQRTNLKLVSFSYVTLQLQVYHAICRLRSSYIKKLYYCHQP